ncbi:ThuA domain-containing protein [Fulvivirgaceae bacterium BMA10]|uniref:ThuA domain-containing protein n=1 Tax=Splendidivirga corallicola TaxID=3051826 RepID=A0ABT8KTW4_9BACT|nr:ThuA domain-containing protein [Fulvivirgaceae bacterium BMA10]
MRYLIVTLLFTTILPKIVFAQSPLRILNFQADNGYEHNSKDKALAMIESLGVQNGWEVVSTRDTAILKPKTLMAFDVVVFNNNCGNHGRIFSDKQQKAFRRYIRNGGGFVGIHCAGAIWHEGNSFQQWFEGLIGTRLIDHPKVQRARLIVEDRSHISTQHLDEEWHITDEYHTFSHNPREHVNVLISLDENSYEGEVKMGGDHPFTWYHHYDGGRSFFTSLGHTKAIYTDRHFQKLVEGGILWSSGRAMAKMPVINGLLLDLDADYDVEIEEGNKVHVWRNQVDNDIKDFIKRDEGRKIAGSGRPMLVLNVPELNGHNTIVFHRQELLNDNEDAFDHLINGSGHTWFSVMSVYEQVPDLPGVNSFFGNLRNSNTDGKGFYEGFWGGFTDDNRPWLGVRNGIGPGRWNTNNPLVDAPEPLKEGKYYLVMGRMASGTGEVTMELFVNDIAPRAKGKITVNPESNPSKMSIGQERDATNHPGKESFDGEIARFLVFERALSDTEMNQMIHYLKERYSLK